MTSFLKSHRPQLLDGLGAQLRQSIASSGRSSTKLAADAGVDRRAVARFVAGSKDLNLDTAGRLAHALGLRLSPAGRSAKPRPSTPRASRAAAPIADSTALFPAAGTAPVREDLECA